LQRVSKPSRYHLNTYVLHNTCDGTDVPPRFDYPTEKVGQSVSWALYRTVSCYILLLIVVYWDGLDSTLKRFTTQRDETGYRQLIVSVSFHT